jgi:hypothetical protein
MTAECCQGFTSANVLGISRDIDLIFIGSGWGRTSSPAISFTLPPRCRDRHLVRSLAGTDA